MPVCIKHRHLLITEFLLCQCISLFSQYVACNQFIVSDYTVFKTADELIFLIFCPRPEIVNFLTYRSKIMLKYRKNSDFMPFRYKKNCPRESASYLAN